eukprot:CFRG5847T1
MTTVQVPVQTEPVTTTQNVERVAILIRESNSMIKVLATVIVVGYLSTFSTSVKSLLSLTPAFVFGRFYVWTIVTATLMETSFINMIVVLWMLFYTASKVVTLWSLQEYMQLLAIVTCASNVLALFCIVWHYALTYDEDVLFKPYGGLGAIVSLSTVVMWKINPEARLQIFSVKLPIRFRHSPLLLAVTVGAQLLIAGSLFSMFSVCAGIVVAWFYMRFYQKVDGVRGDSSTSFAFASQFPELLQPSVEMVSYRIFKLAKLLKLIPKDIKHVAMSLPTGNSDVSRQRQRALRALGELNMEASPNV